MVVVEINLDTVDDNDILGSRRWWCSRERRSRSAKAGSAESAVSTRRRKLEKGGFWRGGGSGGAWAAVVSECGGVGWRGRRRGRGGAREQRQERKAGVFGGGMGTRGGRRDDGRGGFDDGVRVWSGEERQEADGDGGEIVGGGFDEVCWLLSMRQRTLDFFQF